MNFSIPVSWRKDAFRVLSGLALLLCASCVPMLAPPGNLNVTPMMTDDYFLTRDGLKLPLRHWDAQNPRAVILALHGMSDYSRAFEMPAPWWAEHGISTYAYDQRGFGASPDPGLWAGDAVMRQDLDDAVQALRVLHPDLPVFVLGESMGGAVVLSALATKPPHADGIILVAPAVWAREDMPLSYRVALWLAAHVSPGMRLSGSGLKILASDNIEVLRQNGRDPLFQKSARADAVYGLVNLMDEARKAPLHVTNTPPMLFLYGDNDQVIPAAPTKAVVAELNDKVSVRDYPHGYHMLLRDLEGKGVWQDIAAWIAAHEKMPR